MSPDVHIFPDAAAVARQAAAWLTEHARTSVAERGRFAVALAGGSTPRDAYALLREHEVPWAETHVFWTDERPVPPGHPDSNFRMVDGALLAHVDIPLGNVHRIRGELPPREAADSYARELAGMLGAQPQFDLVLLGLGADAHTASLFPFDPLLFERRLPTGISQPRPGGGRRISLTFPVINAARQVAFLVTGESKARAVQQVLGGARDPLRLPAQAVAPRHGELTWFLDRGAADGLPN